MYIHCKQAIFARVTVFLSSHKGCLLARLAPSARVHLPASAVPFSTPGATLYLYAFAPRAFHSYTCCAACLAVSLSSYSAGLAPGLSLVVACWWCLRPVLLLLLALLALLASLASCSCCCVWAVKLQIKYELCPGAGGARGGRVVMVAAGWLVLVLSAARCCWCPVLVVPGWCLQAGGGCLSLFALPKYRSPPRIYLTRRHKIYRKLYIIGGV